LADGGDFTERCADRLAALIGGPRPLLTTSGTHALEVCALLLDLEAGDDVVVPAYTHVSTANPFVLRGARPVFVDVRPDTLNLDEERLADALGSRPRAVVVTHYAGVACEMAPILELAERAGAVVIEDNALGLFGRYRGRALGTLGAASALSFHDTKSISCGEGGALLVNEPSWRERAQTLLDKGTDRARFLRGEVAAYTWQDVGSSYGLSDLLAALLLARLDESRRIQDTRRRIWSRYREELGDWASATDVRLPASPSHCEPSYASFHLILPTPRARRALYAHLDKRGVGTAFHYQALNVSPMGQRLGGKKGQCPVAERSAVCLLRLPLYNDLSEKEQTAVIEAVRDFDPDGARLHPKSSPNFAQ
jgi:dTDP-4-amino-4,6-dideoxygalactose transaminase